MTFEYNLSDAHLKIVKKKKKLIFICKPLKIRDAGSTNWVSTCNNAAFNVLTSEKIQKILVDKEVLEFPFGRISYETAKEVGASFIHRKSIRKSFKIIPE